MKAGEALATSDLMTGAATVACSADDGFEVSFTGTKELFEGPLPRSAAWRHLPPEAETQGAILTNQPSAIPGEDSVRHC